ncbi:helix-turn-helix domain-containing protein [Pontibacter sp. BT310]|uniref:LexA family transcriptional regulator n=2 Tax=Hymenobacteraceae TaxID=1853232 RepID=A0ABS6XCY6_9BACT|nr:helix-turn-helix domain-containing protein [Pontibacter sp. BT310]MBR0570545.1 helix-turn-helix domain-containing protein [Microvirga sp. STS03]MBW3364971.1 LexA family transcriptional regulator [Pontibacter populi]
MVKKLSQAAFAELFNLARPSIGAYEEGRSEPKIETLVQISKHFGLSIDMLLTQELTINDLYGFDIFKRDYTKEESLKKVADLKTVTEPATVLVESNHAFTYIANLHKQEYLQQLPALQFTSNTSNTTRAFEVKGSEMQYEQHGLHAGDILVCSIVDKSDAIQLQPGNIYVMVTQNQILVRRLSNISSGNNLLLKTDNPYYPPLEVALAEVLEIWEVIGVYSTSLNPPSIVEERLTQLEQTVRQLTSKITKLEK